LANALDLLGRAVQIEKNGTFDTLDALRRFLLNHLDGSR
jgi:hypothetical protein